jgi:hypothetical protein
LGSTAVTVLPLIVCGLAYAEAGRLLILAMITPLLFGWRL